MLFYQNNSTSTAAAGLEIGKLGRSSVFVLVPNYKAE